MILCVEGSSPSGTVFVGRYHAKNLFDRAPDFVWGVSLLVNMQFVDIDFRDGFEWGGKDACVRERGGHDKRGCGPREALHYLVRGASQVFGSWTRLGNQPLAGPRLLSRWSEKGYVLRVRYRLGEAAYGAQ
jgi:hypothetical protein